MPAFAQSPCRSARDSVFSIGDSPELAGLRIRSFIDHRWATDLENVGWNPAPSFLWPTVEEHPESSTDDEEDFWRSERHGASHRYTPSSSSVGTSVLFSQEDTEVNDLEYELPSLGTARLQSHRSMPTGRMIYVSKSPTRATKRSGNAGGGVHSSRRSDWSRTLSMLFDDTWNEQYHEQVVSAPLRRQTVHACQTSISEPPSFGFANGHPVPSPSEMPSTQEQDEWQRASGARSHACDHSQAGPQPPQTHIVDPRRSRFTQALSSHPIVPRRASSLPSQKVLTKGYLDGDDDTMMGSDNESVTDDDDFDDRISPSTSPVPLKLCQLPSTPKKTSVTDGSAAHGLQHGGHSPSRARSLSLFPNSPAQTLVDDYMSVHDLKACNSLKTGTEADAVILKSRLRKWWERYCRRNKR